jgi:xanthine/uracil/vitamin C permease (AzgA family)
MGATAAGVAAGLVDWQPVNYRLADIGATAFQLDVRSAMHLGLIEIVFAFLFVDLFDNVGTLVAVGQKAGLFNAAHEICWLTPRRRLRGRLRERRRWSATSKARRVSRQEDERG